MVSLQDLIFSTGPGEQRWADQISKNFDKEVIINISEVPVSVFNVPKAISDLKPEAYIPQVIALGPYHHLRPELYHMERYKIASVRSFLDLNQILNFQTLLIDKLKTMEPTIRACYHKYLDLDDDTLAWIIAIDCLFLLNLLRAYNQGANEDNPVCNQLKGDAVLCRDIMVLENQIPVILLKEIRKTLNLSPPDHAFDSELFSGLLGFCQAHSPLKLAQEAQLPTQAQIFSPLHLLDLMYHLIVNNSDTKLVRQKSDNFEEEEEDDDEEEANVEMENMREGLISNAGEIVNVTLEMGIGGDNLRPVKLINSLPWEKISNLLGVKTVNDVDQVQTNVIKEIKVPSVSNLSKMGGVKFTPISGGIRDIKFVEQEATLYLPVITLNANSEVILRNLVVYEAATSDSAKELAHYVDLMSGIIDTAEDAKLLTANGIINSQLTSEKIADIFSGMNKSTRTGRNKIVERINTYYNNKPKVKLYRFVKKNVYSSWRVLTVLSTILLLLLLTLQAFCDVYGCSRLFGRRS